MTEDPLRMDAPSGRIALAACALVYVAGLVIPLMDVDAAQYASISREMAFGDLPWSIVKNRQLDYLDKPPLLFWLSALSMRLFGAADWAYRLPSMLAGLAAVFAAFRLGRLYGGQRGALASALGLASCQAMFLMMHDVRTDTLLMGMVAVCVWQMAEWDAQQRPFNLLLAWVFLALGMMAKGPIAAIVLGATFGPAWLYERAWRKLFSPWHLAGLALLALLLTPMTLGLYEQYGSRGPEFFYWTQSFGRITGESPWDNNPDPFFLYHTFLWAFLPWPVFVVAGIVCKGLYKPTYSEGSEAPIEGIRVGWRLVPGFLLPLISLSLSKYQLPHYEFVVFPHAAVLAGLWLASYGAQRWVRILGWVLVCLLAAFGILIGAFVFGPAPAWAWAAFGLFIILAILHLRKDESPVIGLVSAMVAVNLMMGLYFYPRLLRFQSPTSTLDIMRARNMDQRRLATYRTQSQAMDFYSTTGLVPTLQNAKELGEWLSKQGTSQPSYLFTAAADWNTVRDSLPPLHITRVDTVRHFHVTILKPAFLNPATRPSVLETKLLLTFSPRP